MAPARPAMSAVRNKRHSREIAMGKYFRKLPIPFRDRPCAPRLIRLFKRRRSVPNALLRRAWHVLRGTCSIVEMLQSAAPALVRHPAPKPCRRRPSGSKLKRTAPGSCSATQFEPLLRIRAQPASACCLPSHEWGLVEFHSRFVYLHDGSFISMLGIIRLAVLILYSR